MEPQMKQRKGSVRDVDPWVAYPVLSDEQSRDVELLEAFAAPIINKRETSHLLRELNSLFPLDDLQHLKRVRACREGGSPHPLEVLVCLVSEAPDMKMLSMEALLASGAATWKGLGEPFIVKVPARPPLTRPQFELASRHWPTSFHEDKRVTVALRGELFSPQQKAMMHMYMTSALAAAESAKELGMEAVGAVMVNPEGGVIAVAHDCRRDHPLHHAVMVCIDLVARSQGGGCYCFDGYAACQGASPKPSAAGGVSVSEASAQPYICSRYDLYVTREPCVMCAMALVHSRIGRVFYGSSSADGALGTKFKVHTQRDLNHRFEVYRGVLSKQCEDLNRPEAHIQKDHLT